MNLPDMPDQEDEETAGMTIGKSRFISESALWSLSTTSVLLQTNCIIVNYNRNHNHVQLYILLPCLYHRYNINVFLADEIIERANHMGRGNHAEVENPDGPYIVQGDIAMTKEQYEEHMAEWKVQEAELIAKGIIKPDK